MSGQVLASDPPGLATFGSCSRSPAEPIRRTLLNQTNSPWRISRSCCSLALKHDLGSDLSAGTIQANPWLLVKSGPSRNWQSTKALSEDPGNYSGEEYEVYTPYVCRSVLLLHNSARQHIRAPAYSVMKLTRTVKPDLAQPRIEYVAGGLYFDSGQAWLPLPDWATFFIEIGSHLGQFQHSSNRLVVAVAVPARAYVAALAAMGAVSAGAIQHGDDETKSQHFQRLCQLPKGTPVIFRRSGKFTKAVLVGCDQSDGIARIGVREYKSLHCWLPLSECLRIEVASAAIATAPARRVPYRVPSKPFLQSMLPGLDIGHFATHTSFDCAILGRLNALRRELTTTSLGNPPITGTCIDRGTFQDILRAKRLLPKDYAYRSDVFPVEAKKSAIPASKSKPLVTVFDGSLAFLKWRDDWRQGNWMVILDRTEAQFDGAVAALRQEHSSRVSDHNLQTEAELPSGVELLAYEESSR